MQAWMLESLIYQSLPKEKGLEMDGNGGFTAGWLCLKPLNCILEKVKMIDFVRWHISPYFKIFT